MRIFNAAPAGLYENSPSIFRNVFTIDLLLKFNGSQFHLENVNLLTLAVEKKRSVFEGLSNII